MIRLHRGKIPAIIVATIFLGVGIIATLFAKKTDFSGRKNRRYNFSYQVDISGPFNGGNISVWVPYPVEDRYQNILNSKIISPLPVNITTDRRYGNRMVFINGKPAGNKIHLEFNYKILRSTSTGYRPGEISQNRHLSPERFLGPNRLLPNAPLFERIAHSVINGKTEKEKKIRLLYKYVVDSMEYDKSGSGWGRGDPVWACSSKRGNCTDFHSLYIALVRSQKIPARFLIGFAIPDNKRSGEIKGYHCWAQVYAPGIGWLPLDATDGKKSGNPGSYFGRLPANRIQFSTGRDIRLNPEQTGGELLNYFIYPYVELDNQKYTNFTTRFFFKNYE